MDYEIEDIEIEEMMAGYHVACKMEAYTVFESDDYSHEIWRRRE